jgi:hypothetical protein
MNRRFASTDNSPAVGWSALTEPSKCCQGIGSALKSMGLSILKTPFRAPPSERFLRTPRWKHAPRVFGFPDSAERQTPTGNSQGVGRSLQPRPPPLQPGAWHSRTLRRHTGGTNFKSPYSAWSPSGRNSHPGRSAPRIPTGEASVMKSGRKFGRAKLIVEHSGVFHSVFLTDVSIGRPVL